MTSSTVRAYLISEGIAGSGTSSGSAWVCLVGGLSDAITAPQIAVIDTGGLSPLASHGNAGPTRPGIQVIVRGLPGAYAATETKAQDVWDALHRSSFDDLLAVEGVNNPIWLGYREDTNAPQWSLNFLTIQR
jgi:hypothetical protein